MQDSIYRFNYLKEFIDITEIGENSFPLYQKRSLEQGEGTLYKYVRGNHVLMDNRNIVPYPPYLIKKYNYYINIEFYATIQFLKYIFKYITKGYDLFIVEMEYNEVLKYETQRYVSSCEAYFRISNYDLINIEPSLLQLFLNVEDK